MKMYCGSGTISECKKQIQKLIADNNKVKYVMDYGPVSVKYEFSKN